MTKEQKTERAKMVLAMEYIARQVNDEEVFDRWLTYGVPDGDIKYGQFDTEKVDEYLLETETFRDLMDTFLYLMGDAQVSGGLFCGSVTTVQG